MKINKIKKEDYKEYIELIESRFIGVFRLPENKHAIMSMGYVTGIYHSNEHFMPNHEMSIEELLDIIKNKIAPEFIYIDRYNILNMSFYTREETEDDVLYGFVDSDLNYKTISKNKLELIENNLIFEELYKIVFDINQSEILRLII